MMGRKARGAHSGVRDLIAKAEVAGFRVEQTAGGHIVFFPPTKDHPPIYGSSTPSDARGVKNLRAMLVKAGLPKAA